MKFLVQSIYHIYAEIMVDATLSLDYSKEYVLVMGSTCSKYTI